MGHSVIFTFKIIQSKVYNVVFQGLSAVNTIIALITSKMTHTFVSSAEVNVIHTILKNIALSTSLKLRTDFVNTILINNPITVVLKETGKIFATVSLSIAQTYVFKETLRTSTSISIGNSIAATPVLAILHLLSLYDPETLGTLDVQTLGDLDYTET